MRYVIHFEYDDDNPGVYDIDVHVVNDHDGSGDDLITRVDNDERERVLLKLLDAAGFELDDDEHDPVDDVLSAIRAAGDNLTAAISSYRKYFTAGNRGG